MRLLSQQSPNRTPKVIIPKGKKNVSIQSIVPLTQHEQRGAKRKRKSQKSEIMTSSSFTNLLEENEKENVELEEAKAKRALKKNKNGEKIKKGKAQGAKKKLILNSVENTVPSKSSANNEGTIFPGCEQTYDEDWIQCIVFVLYATTTKFSGCVLLASRPAYSYPPRRLTSFLAPTADETLNSFPIDQNYYRSASNSLLARTADRTPKMFALQGDPSRSTFPPSSKRSPYIVSPAGRDFTWNDLVHSSVPPLLMEISRRFQHL
ncbi:hypothetical protein AVEN_27057-1 [Araneus ventricosus]|uniref:Uncharacterized protein n=1 Tax=Araneus ventricosus TaxID=182803 RepID=A0A4Y2JEY5_ARAVE|nr:hypothetical protein AVEN_27057-1 [Araneus ventricosus]